MNAPDLYCATCGAANQLDTPVCFACGNALSNTENNHEQAALASSEILLNSRYRILSPVGEGGFARVYRAEDTQTKKIVAIKVISLKSLSSQEIIDATDTYNREIRFGQTLKHSFLPAILDHFMDQDHWYLVAEFIDGQTLEEYQRRLPTGYLPIWEVFDIGIQVCDVLAYLHSRQPPIIFRDVKPDNIMRTQTGHIYLVDFGIARQYRPGLRRDTQTLGSPGYAAPEQYGSAQTTERSDIYSLGATLRALLTGINPLDDGSATEENNSRQPATIPRELSELLSQMLEKDPEKRPETIEAVKQQLESIAEKIGIVLHRTQKFTRQDSLLYSPPANSPIFPPATPPVSSTSSSGTSRWSKLVLFGLTLVVILGISGGIGVLSTSHSSSIQSYTDTSIAVTPTTPSLDPQSFVFGESSTNYISESSLDPVTTSSFSSQLVSLLYAGLVQLDDSLQVKPQLASSWQQDASGTIWTFKLRPNLKFSDGSSLTSEDVAFSLDRALDPALQSPTASYAFRSIKGADQRMAGTISTLIGSSIIPTDPSTLKIITTSKISFLPYALTCPCASVVEKALFEKYGSAASDHLGEDGVSGPFKISYRASSEDRLDLVANPYYYGPKPHITKISYLATYDAFSNQLTMNSISPSDLDRAKTDTGFHQIPALETTFYAMNYQIKPFDNTKIRQAFALALDKELITQTTQGGTAFATNHIIPQGQRGYTPTLKGPDGTTSLKGNVVLARQLLQEGLQEEGMSQLPPITFTFASDGSSEVKDEVSAAQKMWRDALGITVQLKDISYNDLIQQIEGVDKQAPQMWRSGWIADYPDPQDWTSLQFGKGSFYNRVSYGQNSSADAASQQAVQQMLQMADAMPNNQDRLRIYQDAEQKLVNDVAWIPIYQQQQSYLLQPKVHGFTLNGLGFVSPDDWAKITLS